jgi:hypothetical protein
MMIMACCEQMQRATDQDQIEFYPGWHDSLPRSFRQTLQRRYGPANAHQPRVLVIHLDGPVPISFCPFCGFMLIGQIEGW